jgi:hypothetical protein
MRRTDARPRALDTSWTRPLGSVCPTGPHPDLVSLPFQADGAAEDHAEQDPSNWETAWIDIGGEG